MLEPEPVTASSDPVLSIPDKYAPFAIFTRPGFGIHLRSKVQCLFLSAVGMKSDKKGLATAGLIIGIIGVALVLFGAADLHPHKTSNAVAGVTRSVSPCSKKR